MYLPRTLLLALLAYSPALALSPAKRAYDTHNYYVLEHNPFGASLVDIAQALGVEIVEQAGELRHHWLVRAEKPLEGVVARGELSDRVLETFESLRGLSSRPPDVSRRSEDTRDLASSITSISRQIPRQRVKRAPPPIRPPLESSSSGVAARLGIQDPLFSKQWHLVNDEYPEHMMNATPVWEMGLTGKGVISSLVDDGLDYTSEDLKDNFDADDSYDFNDHESLPTPKLYDDHHGTRCAGQIAAGKNTACGIGIAYESKVAGVRILSGPISDVDEAAALNYGFQNVSIYSCSWGPPDNGMSMEGPSSLIKKAVINGINHGRGGKGSIFVFASGNGAAHGDQCNFDGYTNSIYSVTVSAVDYKGLHPYYSEPCAANMIVAYSSGSGQHIVTTDKGQNSCATTHGGTSAAAPNAVGVFALALEARPDLTWRDIQHLCVETARMINPEDPDWENTAAGRRYSYKYGFGVLDAYRYVKAAQDWTLVKPQSWIKTHTVQLEGGKMTEEGQYTGGQFIAEGGVKSSIEVTAGMLKDSNFEKLEHVNVQVWISHRRRGDVEVELVSPKGIKSVLGALRSSDSADTGYPGWIFMTVKHWGEDPTGSWTIRVSDQSSADTNGTFLGWNMMFWGSAIDPAQKKLYELPPDDDAFPPHEDPTPTPSPTPSATKQHSKPTNFLSSDHGSAPGENTNPAFPASTSTPQDDAALPAASSAAATSTPTADEGWFSDMGNLVSNQKWFFAAIGGVAVFVSAAAAIFFWRRRVAQRKRAAYTTLPQGGEGLPMSSITGRGGGSARTGGPRTKELYDAFGEVSDDEDADEETHLRSGRSVAEGLGFHSGFLDDDEPPSAPASGLPSGKYRDVPDEDEPSGGEGGSRLSPRDQTGTATSSVSGDGSWEHAS